MYSIQLYVIWFATGQGKLLFHQLQS